MLVFGLGGSLKLPPTVSYTPPPLDPPAVRCVRRVIKTAGSSTPETVPPVMATGAPPVERNFPDLTRTPLLTARKGSMRVVLKGILSSRGMASFAPGLKPDDTKALRAYIIDRANDAKKALAAAPPPGPAVSQPHQ